MPKRRSSTISLVLTCAVLGVVLVTGFADYELNVDSSIVAGVWQSLRGNRTTYTNLSLTLPPRWIALRQEHRLMLVSVSHRKTTIMFLQATPQIKPSEWEQHRTQWIEYEESEYRSQGYKLIAIPSIVVFGAPAICLAASPAAELDAVSMKCVAGNGMLFATYEGSAAKVPEFASILGSLEKLSQPGQ